MLKKLVQSLLTLACVILVMAVALGGALALVVRAGGDLSQSAVVACDDSGGAELAPYRQRSMLLDRYGDPLPGGVLFADEDRDAVPLDEMPDHLKAAVIAIEDRSFFEHNGVDVRGTLRALSNNAKGESVQGGSTITQQLVKNTLIDNAERTLDRKLREACLAKELERRYSKNEILERYLNTVYFGRGAYGVKAASERYFNHASPMELTPAQSALLAGLISNPEGNNPVNYPRRAERRRNEVVRAMRDVGAITPAEARTYRREPVPRATYQVAEYEPRNYYVAEVIRRLLQPDSPLGPDAADRLYGGGLRIHTSFDPTTQAQVELSVANEFLDIEAESGRSSAPFSAAVAVIDNPTGQVLAIYGGRNFDENQTNMATQARRQAGSTFKTFTVAAALERGYSPNDLLSGGSCRWYYPVTTDQSPDGWSAGTHTSGTSTITSQLASSINCAFGRLELSMGHGTVGPQAVIDAARKLGVSEEENPDLPPVTSITLGTGGVTPLSMAVAYSTIANDGVRRDPVFVTRIEDARRRTIWQAPEQGAPVIEANTARTLTEMMTQVITRGTASSTANIGRPAAGKTGTTNDHKDAWFVGYTPQLTAAVWMGDPGDTTGRAILSLEELGVGDVFGGSYPARIWASVMRAALADQPVEYFEDPDESLWPTPRLVDEDGGRTLIPRFAPPPVPSPSADPGASPPPAPEPGDTDPVRIPIVPTPDATAAPGGAP